MALPGPILDKRRIRALKGIIYGPPGSGKTTFGAAAPRALLLDLENGAAHVECHRTPYLADWKTAFMWLDAIVQEKDIPYKTVVIDTLDWLLRRAEEYVAGTDAAGILQTLNRAHGGYGAGKQVLKNVIFVQLLPRLDYLVNKNIHVILLAHAGRRVLTTLDGAETEKSVPGSLNDLTQIFVEWSDFVGAIRVMGDKRELVLNETNQLVAKNRYNIKSTLPLAWAEFEQAVVKEQQRIQGEQ